MSQSPREPEALAEGTLISHLLELRGRLVHAFIAIILVFIPAAFFRNDIFEHLARPLVEQLPKGSTMIATSVMSPFIAPFTQMSRSACSSHRASRWRATTARR